jgi:hypothetical protein
MESMVKRYVVGMDFQGGSPVVNENDDYGEEHYPRDREPYRKWRFVREEDYDAAVAALTARVSALEAEVRQQRLDAMEQASQV